jgi:hypothetical protein
VVYFVQAVDGGPIKIGHSVDVERRIGQLEADFKRKLAVLAVIPGGRIQEREIHDRFSHLRLGKTEQFRPAQDLLDFIGRPLLVSVNPELVEAMDSEPSGCSAVRIRSDVAAKARIAASYEGESITDLLSNLLDPLLTKLINDGHARISKMSPGPKGKRSDPSE